MQRGKVLVVILLMVVPLLATGRIVAGQAYSTQTVTTMVTNTQTSTVVTGSSVGTSTVPQAKVVFSSPLTIPPTHGVCGVYFNQPFNATEGENLVGNLTATSNVDFYVLTDAAYQSWSRQIVAGGICTPGSLVLSQKNTTAYNFTIPIPASGLYEIVLNNLSHSSVNANLTVALTTSSLAMTTIAQYSTLTQPTAQTLTLVTLETAQPEGTPGGTSMLLVGVVVAVIIIALIAFAARARRGRKSAQ